MEIVLSARYKKNKSRLKDKITQGIQTWHEIAGILMEIKTSGDWKQEFKTWDEFCVKCCDFTKRQANSLISDEKAWLAITEAFPEVGSHFPPVTQLAVQETRKLPTVEAQAEALIEATENGTKSATKKAIKKAVEKRAKARVVGTQPSLAIHIPLKDSTEDYEAEKEVLIADLECSEYTEIIDKLVEQEWPISDQKDKTKEAIARIFRFALIHIRNTIIPTP